MPIPRLTYSHIRPTRAMRGLAGPRPLVRGARADIEEQDDATLLIPDVDGNRYRVDITRLDARSRRLFECLV